MGRGRTAGHVTFGPGRFADLYARVNPGILEGRVDGLPTDAASLAPFLRRELERATDFNPDPGAYSLQMLQVLEQILANPLASPELRSGVYEIAAELEGVRIDQDAVDPAGRRGTAFALCSAAIPARYEVFFDPVTSTTLGMREVSPAACDGAPSDPSGLTSFTVYSREAIVDSIHQRS